MNDIVAGALNEIKDSDFSESLMLTASSVEQNKRLVKLKFQLNCRN